MSKENEGSGQVERLVVRETFSTDGQYNKYLKIKAFFEKLLQLKKNGYFFMVDDELYKTPFIDGWEMGFVDSDLRIMFTGCTHELNKETGEYDTPWIDVTMNDLRERIIPLRREKL